jgi:hypothetical protein
VLAGEVLWPLLVLRALPAVAARRQRRHREHGSRALDHGLTAARSAASSSGQRYV